MDTQEQNSAAATAAPEATKTGTRYHYFTQATARTRQTPTNHPADWFTSDMVRFVRRQVTDIYSHLAEVPTSEARAHIEVALRNLGDAMTYYAAAEDGGLIKAGDLVQVLDRHGKLAKDLTWTNGRHYEGEEAVVESREGLQLRIRFLSDIDGPNATDFTRKLVYTLHGMFCHLVQPGFQPQVPYRVEKRGTAYLVIDTASGKCMGQVNHNTPDAMYLAQNLADMLTETAARQSSTAQTNTTKDNE